MKFKSLLIFKALLMGAHGTLAAHPADIKRKIATPKVKKEVPLNLISPIQI